MRTKVWLPYYCSCLLLQVTIVRRILGVPGKLLLIIKRSLTRKFYPQLVELNLV